MATVAPAGDPIFIVGLPRAGSTLLEQILASHSQVEGTMELPDMPAIARSLARPGGRATWNARAELSAAQCARARRAVPRNKPASSAKTAAPFFIDKMPNNFAHLGLIHLFAAECENHRCAPPSLGCCFSGFKQHFARGQNFSYSQESIGRYYRDYVELMAHFDEALPGRVHRVIYEAMIDDTEARGALCC